MTLAQRLEEELKYEKEAGTDAVPDFVNEFNAQGVWEVCWRLFISANFNDVLINGDCFVTWFHRSRTLLAMTRLR